MRTALAAVWATILCAFFVQTANALQTDLISLKADSVFASSVIGLMMATYYLGYVMGPLIGRVVIGRIGHVNTVLVTMLLPAAVILLQPLVVTAPAWALFRALSGFALAISYVAVESWIHESVGNGLRGRVFSLYMFAQLVGMTLAQGLLTFGTADTYYMYVLAAALFLVAAVPVLSARNTAPSGAPPKPLPLITLFRLAPRGALITLLAGLSWSIFFTFGPVYAKRVGFDMAGIGFLMAISVAAGGVMQMPAGWMSDRWGRKPVLLILFGGGVVASLIGMAFDGAPAHLIAAALSGGFIFPIYAVAAALVNDGVRQEVRVAAASGLVLLFGFGSIFGPLLCGVAMGAMGPAGFFALVAATMVAGLAVLFLVPEKVLGARALQGL